MQKQKCIKCGKCCGYIVPITKNEKIKIEKYIQEKKINSIKRNFTKKYIDCKFLNNENECIIYDVRPSICKNFNCNKNFC